MFVANLIYMTIWAHTSEVGAKRLRESYLAAILRQDIAYFDNVGAGEVATRIETDTRERLRLHCCALVFTLDFQISSSKVSLRRLHWPPISCPLSSSVSSSHSSANGNSPLPCLRSFP